MQWSILRAGATVVVGLAVGTSALRSARGEGPEEGLPRSRSSAEFLGRGSISGTARDRTESTKLLRDGSPENRLGGHGSGIAWTGIGDEYLMVADRGPKDGATEYTCRFHELKIRVNPVDRSVVPEVVATRLLRDGARPLIGSADALDPAAGSRRFDPEAIRFDRRRGSVYISEEYGPLLARFSRTGTLQESWTVPKTRIDHPSSDPMEELPPRNRSGRQPNRGFEGLALSEDGEFLYAILQGPLLQDHAIDAENRRHGRNVRLFEVATASGRVTREFVYQLENPSLVLSETEWLGPGRLLVIERDGKPGVDGGQKWIVEIDFSRATDVQTLAQLPAGKLPGKVRPVEKSLLIDLLSPEYGLAGEGFPEKIEGLAFGPRLPDGRRLLLVTSDNDFRADQPTYIFAFAIGR